MQTVRANAKTRHCTDEDLKMEIIEGDSISKYMYKNCLDFFQGQHGGWSLKQLPAAPVVSLLHSTNTKVEKTQHDQKNCEYNTNIQQRIINPEPSTAISQTLRNNRRLFLYYYF